MPLLAPSHTAPVLPLKLWKPHLFSGLALAIGAAAPDLEFILRLDTDWIVSHTFAAQIYFTVPLVMILHGILTSYVLPWAIPFLPSGAPWHLHDLALIRPAASARDWLRVAVSGFLGGLSHVLIDGFTHGNHTGWAVALLPALRTPVAVPPLGSWPLYDVLQGVLSVVLGVLGLDLLADIARRRCLVSWSGEAPPMIAEATPAERREALQYGIMCALLGMAAGFARGEAVRGRGFETAVHGTLAFLFYGVILAAFTDRLRARRAAKGTFIESEG